jgi:threonine/homoserine/homoserine lactone efflux protein
MLGIHDFWLFLLSGILLNLTPGQDTFYILGRSIAGGRRVGFLSVLGIATGSIVHTLAAALGLSTLLATSTTAFSIVKFAGAAYLIYLGVRLLLSRSATIVEETPSPVSSHYWSAYRQGVLSNVLNPKVALFFIAFLPQFIAVDSSHKVAAFLALGGTFVFTGTVWCMVLAIGAARFREFFVRNPSARAVIDRCVGGVFVALGLRLAVTK